MGIQSSSVNIDGTVATSAGTATGMIVKGGNLNELVTVLDDSSEFIAQTKIRFSIVDPKVQTSAPNGYTQARSIVKVVVPLALDNLSYTTNTLEIRLGVDPEASDSEIESMLVLGAQLLADSDFSDFWKKQSLS